MDFPELATFLVVGAGPSGLACAISLFQHGARDIAVVDGAGQRSHTSRAIVIHAATLEVYNLFSVSNVLHLN